MTVRYRPLGRTGLTVSAVGVGCSRLGGMFSTDTTERDEVDLLRRALDAGITFFDTADMYSQGRSEVLVGKALRGRRDEAVIATKGGYVWPANRRWLAKAKPLLRPVARVAHLDRRRARGRGGSGDAGPAVARDFSPRHLVAAVEGSLRRLRTDHIDVYQLHSPTRSVVEAGDYVDTLERLRAQGKIDHFGIAVDTPADALGLDAVPAIATIQTPFSLLEPAARDALFPLAEGRGLGVMARSCFAAGLLKDGLSAGELRARTDDWDQILKLQETARRIGRPLLETALQYSLGTRPIAVTIIGMWRPSQLDTNLRWANASPLDPTEFAAFDA